MPFFPHAFFLFAITCLNIFCFIVRPSRFTQTARKSTSVGRQRRSPVNSPIVIDDDVIMVDSKELARPTVIVDTQTSSSELNDLIFYTNKKVVTLFIHFRKFSIYKQL